MIDKTSTNNTYCGYKASISVLSIKKVLLNRNAHSC